MIDYLRFNPSGEMEQDIKAFFSLHNKKEVYQHTLDVINELMYIYEMFGRIEGESLTACYLHDIGRVVKNEDILHFCDTNYINTTDEERLLPSILHQKTSCFIAKKVFGVSDEKTLQAIRYHTTLRKKPSIIELEVFLADKMSWKEDEYRELALKVKEALTNSKEYAAYVYLSDLNKIKDELIVYHIDSREAFEYFQRELMSRKS